MIPKYATMANEIMMEQQWPTCLWLYDNKRSLSCWSSGKNILLMIIWPAFFVCRIAFFVAIHFPGAEMLKRHFIRCDIRPTWIHTYSSIMAPGECATIFGQWDAWSNRGGSSLIWRVMQRKPNTSRTLQKELLHFPFYHIDNENGYITPKPVTSDTRALFLEAYLFHITSPCDKYLWQVFAT